MELKNIHDLFILHLKDLYSAETQLVQALPQMAEAASSETLKQGFEEHLKQTEEHVKRLEKIGELLEFGPGGHSCKAMKALIEEGSDLMKMEGEATTIDAGLIAAAQKVEHYEICAYATAATMAELMQHNEAAELLKQTLDEEKTTDEKLNQVAMDEVNPQALEMMEGMETN